MFGKYNDVNKLKIKQVISKCNIKLYEFIYIYINHLKIMKLNFEIENTF